MDRKEDLSQEAHTLKKVQAMANMMIEGIKFTIDLPANPTSGKVPMLDLAA